MPKRIVRGLSDRRVRTCREPGMLADGHGLYLRITDRRTKGWIFRYQVAGQRHDMGLGSVDDVSLAEARERAHELRRLLWQGVDPISDRRAKRSTARAAALKTKSFMECAELYIADHKAAWKSAKHRSQWENTLKTYAYPIIGKLGVHMIDTALVTEIVRPIWATKSATASRLRGRIELILDWAKVQGFRHGENPARWKGHLDALLPKPGEVHRTKHHAALPYAEINKFAVDLRRYDGVNARALEFAMLVGGRTREVRLMKWPEVDLAKRLWIVPAERMKMEKEHRVPLSARALAIIREMAAIRTSDYVFPGTKPGRPLGANALLQMLARMGRKGAVTSHGFRSTLSDWCAEQTHFPEEVREMAIAHAVGDKVEAAYRRGDLFAKRRHLMDAWAAFIERKDNDAVIPLRLSA